MATTSTKPNTALPDFEAATERAREANERLLDAGHRVSSGYLDAVEKHVAGLVRCE